MITKEDLKLLTMPFKDETLGVKVNNFSKDRTKAMLVLYLQHTDVYARIEEVDPAWTCSTGPAQFIGKIIAIPMKLTIKDVTRENVGEGEDYKSAYSDAIKRAAMLFGIGRYLYDAPQVWVPYNEQIDKYKKWTIQDYRGRLPAVKKIVESGPSADPKLAESEEKKSIAKTLVKNLKQAKGESHEHAWRPSKFVDQLTGDALDWCVTCKITRARQVSKEFDDQEDLPF